MNFNTKEKFVSESAQALGEIYEAVNISETLKLKDLPARNTVLVVIDLQNGFTRQGVLKSARVETVIPEIVKLSEACKKNRIKQVALVDCHTDDSLELREQPPHCLEGSEESEIVDELKAIGVDKVIKKNSINGFLEEKFLQWLCFYSSSRQSDSRSHDRYNDIDNVIIVGAGTDSGIMQFALTLKAWFNMDNNSTNVIVPLNAVETFDSELHNGDLANVMAAFFMKESGIKLVKEIEL